MARPKNKREYAIQCRTAGGEWETGARIYNSRGAAELLKTRLEKYGTECRIVYRSVSEWKEEKETETDSGAE